MAGLQPADGAEASRHLEVKDYSHSKRNAPSIRWHGWSTNDRLAGMTTQVVTLVEANPRILTDIPPADLKSRIAHWKAATSPMGSQLAAMWEKDPQVGLIA